mgnify:CR=1 FL=1
MKIGLNVVVSLIAFTISANAEIPHSPPLTRGRQESSLRNFKTL